MKKEHYRMIIAGMLLMLGLGIPINGMGAFTVPVTGTLGFTVAQFSIVSSCLSLIGIVSIPVLSKTMIPKIGLRKTAFIGGITGILGFIWMANSTSLWSFYLSASLIGLMLMVSTSMVSVTMVNNWFERKHGTVMGIVAASMGLSGVIVNAVIPSVVENNGFRAGYYLMAVLYGAAVLGGALLLRDKPEDLGTTAYGKSESAIKEPNATLVTNESDESVPAGMTFAEALRSPIFYFAAIVFVSFVMVSTFTQQLQVFLVSSGINIVQVGAMMSIASVAMIIAKITMGTVSDKVGSKTTYAGLAIIFTSAFVIFLSTSSPIILFIALLMYYVCAGTPNVMHQLIALDLFGKKEFTAIWGVLSVAANVGLALGNPVLGLLYDLTGTYDLTIIVCIALMIISLIFFFLATHSKKKEYQSVENYA